MREENDMKDHLASDPAEVADGGERSVIFFPQMAKSELLSVSATDNEPSEPLGLRSTWDPRRGLVIVQSPLAENRLAQKPSLEVEFTTRGMAADG